MENEEIKNDLPEIQRLMGELLKKLVDSPVKSRYRSPVITHLEIAEGFLDREENSQ